MARLLTNMRTNHSNISSTMPTETHTLKDKIHNSKCTGGNYGSLAKSKIQPTFYVCHQVEPDDTLQRVALKYNIKVCLFQDCFSSIYIIFQLKIEEIKRINQLWSDNALGLFEHVYIPVNSTQLSTLQSVYPTLNIVRNLPPITNHLRNPMTNKIKTHEAISSDSSVLISTASNLSCEEYFSRIDQQIRLTKETLQSMTIKEQHLRYWRKCQ